MREAAFESERVEPAGDAFLVRRARAEDVPAILEISNEAAATTAANFAIEPESIEPWQASFEATSETHPWLVAVDRDDVVVAFAKGSPWKGRCAYAYSAEVTVYVRPAWRGRGVGRALYDRLLATLARQGYRSAVGGITLPNPASVRLHESFGMERVALFPRIGFKFGRWHDVGYWQKSFGEADAPPVDRIRKVSDVW